MLSRAKLRKTDVQFKRYRATLSYRIHLSLNELLKCTLKARQHLSLLPTTRSVRYLDLIKCRLHISRFGENISSWIKRVYNIFPNSKMKVSYTFKSALRNCVCACVRACACLNYILLSDYLMWNQVTSCVWYQTCDVTAQKRRLDKGSIHLNFIQLYTPKRHLTEALSLCFLRKDMLPKFIRT